MSWDYRLCPVCLTVHQPQQPRCIIHIPLPTDRALVVEPSSDTAYRTGHEELQLGLRPHREGR